MEKQLKELIENLIYESKGFQTVAEPLINVKNSEGVTYQIHLVATKDEMFDVTRYPDMKIYDGELIEEN